MFSAKTTSHEYHLNITHLVLYLLKNFWRPVLQKHYSRQETVQAIEKSLVIPLPLMFISPFGVCIFASNANKIYICKIDTSAFQ